MFSYVQNSYLFLITYLFNDLKRLSRLIMIYEKYYQRTEQHFEAPKRLMCGLVRSTLVGRSSRCFDTFPNA